MKRWFSYVSLLFVAVWFGGCSEPTYGPLRMASSVSRNDPAPSLSNSNSNGNHAADLLLGDLGFMHIREGASVLGSPDEEPGHTADERQRWAAIVDPFFLQTTEVTQSQFEQRMGFNPSGKLAENLPVTGVCWDEAVEFCLRLETEFPDHRFRLPTEDEWEYACRAMTTALFAVLPDQIEELEIALTKFKAGDAGFVERFARQFAHFDESGPHSVASLNPNAWGLYDMQGNVWEWSANDDLVDPDLRPIRGGAWSSTNVWNCRAAVRSEEFRDTRKDSIGFRVVAEPR